MRNVDVVGILNDDRRRKRTRDGFNAQDTTEVFHIPVSGQAGTAIFYVATEQLNFAKVFSSQQGVNGVISPVFNFGFELFESGENVIGISGLHGVAKVGSWVRDEEYGYYKAATCHVGVVNMSEGVVSGASVPFEGVAHLSFSGPAISPPYDMSSSEG